MLILIFVSLQACCRAQKPRIPKIRKSTKSPTPGWPLKIRKHYGKITLATGKYGCTEVWVYPAECGEQLGTDPSKIGSSKSLVLKSFSGEGTLWDSSLPVSLTLWDTPALFTPPLPLPQLQKWPISGNFWAVFGICSVYFFSDFRGPARGRGFVFFSYFRDSGVLGLCEKAGPQDHNSRCENSMEWTFATKFTSDCDLMHSAPQFGFGKRGLLERGLFRKVHLLEVLENLEILEIWRTPRLWKTKENPTIF